MDANAFRQELRRKLEQNRDRVLLRIVLAPDFDQPVELTGSDLLQQAERLTALYAVPEQPQTVLLLLPHSAELFLLHLGLILKGHLPAILPWPTSRIDPEKYQRNLLHQLRHLPAGQLITLPRLAASLSADLPYVATPCPIEAAADYEKHFASIAPADVSPSSSAARVSGAAPEDAIFLQFSGGTTGTQKCVVVTAPMLTEQLAQLSEVLDFSDRDSVVSWLPMYHDMGLIACLWLPLWQGAPSLQFSATDWLVRPELLFKYIHEYNGTFCWLPNFAFSYLAEHLKPPTKANTAPTMRAWINCSEPVRLTSMKSFADAFAESGVTPESLQACYAMAENVFAVTQTPPGKIPATFPRDRVRQNRRAYPERAFDLLDDVYVSSGRRMAGMEVRIVDPNGRIQADAEPGEIQIRTRSLFAGYWGNNGFTVNSLSAEGWYSTGDYGFIADGDLFVIGRMKDIIIVAGQNVFPEDVEAIVNTVDGVYPGRVVAFGVEDDQNGTESLVVVAEMRGLYTQSDADALKSSIQGLVLSTVGIAPRHVAVVPERWVVKSTAGKISRRDTRMRFLRELTPALATAPSTKKATQENNSGMAVHRRLENVFQAVFRTRIPLTDDISAPDIPGWDSVNHVNLMFTIESEFQVQFAGNELAEFRNIGELKRYLEARTQS